MIEVTLTDDFARDAPIVTGNPKLKTKGGLGWEPAGGFDQNGSTIERGIILINLQGMPLDTSTNATLYRYFIVAHEFAHALFHTAHLASNAPETQPDLFGYFRKTALMVTEEYRADKLAWQALQGEGEANERIALMDLMCRNALHSLKHRLGRFAILAPDVFKAYMQKRLNVAEVFDRFLASYWETCGNVMHIHQYAARSSASVKDWQTDLTAIENQVFKTMLPLAEFMAQQDPVPEIAKLLKAERRFMAVGETAIRKTIAIWGKI
jgi:hypothetical protein